MELDGEEEGKLVTRIKGTALSLGRTTRAQEPDGFP